MRTTAGGSRYRTIADRMAAFEVGRVYPMKELRAAGIVGDILMRAQRALLLERVGYAQFRRRKP